MSRNAYVTKALLIYFLVIVDIVINGFNDEHMFGSSSSFAPYVWIGAQIGIQFINAVIFMLLVFGTYLFQVGLISHVLRHFRTTVYTMIAYLIVYGVYAAVKLSLFIGDNKMEYELWSSKSFEALSIIQKLAALGYYLVIIQTTFRFGQGKWYNRDPWVTKFSEMERKGGVNNGLLL